MVMHVIFCIVDHQQKIWLVQFLYERLTFIHTLQADLERQAGRLRKTQPQVNVCRHAEATDPLLAALQQGIAKMAVHSIASDNTTGSTETWETCAKKQ